MTSRTLLTVALVAGTAGAALADVEVKTPGVQVKTPAGGVNLDVDVGSKPAPSDAWIGRSVYSTDGKNLGEVAAVVGDQVYADIGGFLGIGETRVQVGADQIDRVEGNRIVLKLTEAEAKDLPSTDAPPTVPN